MPESLTGIRYDRLIPVRVSVCQTVCTLTPIYGRHKMYKHSDKQKRQRHILRRRMDCANQQQFDAIFVNLVAKLPDVHAQAQVITAGSRLWEEAR